MDNLVMYFVGTELILLLSCFLLYLLSEKTIKSIVSYVLIYIVGGVPLLYMVLDHLSNPILDANIGLGLFFIYTWLFSVVTLAIFVGKILLKRRKK